MVAHVRARIREPPGRVRVGDVKLVRSGKVWFG